MSVTLAKVSDAPVVPYFTRQWISTVDLHNGLTSLYGAFTGDLLYSRLADNDLNAVQDTLIFRDRYDNSTGELATVNVPDHKGTTTTHAEPVDYRDGYGYEYAVGE